MASCTETTKAKRKKHVHYWSYPHTIWQGRKDSECTIARWCACGKTQVAFASDWQEVPASFPDIRDYLNKSLKGIKR